MPATPANLAEAPEDLLGKILRGVRLSGSVYLDGRFSAPFGVESPARWDGAQPLAHLRHTSVFHLLASGSCTMQTEDGATVDLQAGDLVLLPFTAQHRFWCGRRPEVFAFAPDLLQPGPIGGVGVVAHGGGGEECRFVCGFIESAELMPAPLFRSLPPVLVEATRGDNVAGPIAETAGAILRTLAGDPQPGAQAVLGRLMELLFLEILRRHATTLPAGAGGVLAATRDPIVSRALSKLHADVTRSWTVEDLAREVGASRTVLGERFKRLLGKPPMEYLAAWRVQVASDRLRSSRDSVAAVANAVGYESEAAFSRAFRRVTACSPGAWRNGQGA